MRAKKGVDVRSVGHWRSGSETCGVMSTFVGHDSIDFFSPAFFSIIKIDGNHKKLMSAIDIQIVMCSRSTTGFRIQFFSDSNSCGHKNRVTPNDGRAVTSARDRRLPKKILGIAPLQRRICVCCDAGAQRATPVGPIFCLSFDKANAAKPNDKASRCSIDHLIAISLIFYKAKNT